MTEEELNDIRFQKAIELVLCAECKYYGIFRLCTFNGRLEPVEFDDYCSHGETE